MKNLKILYILLLLATCVSGQQIYVAGALDPKMAYEGPHNNGGVLNPEISLGFVIDNEARIWMGYEWLSQISYQKYTILAADYFINLSDRFNVKIGPEFSIIYRHMDNPDYYKYNYSDDNWSYGINGEVEYKFFDNLSVFTNCNVFKAEKKDNLGNPMKEYRWDVRIGMIVYLFEM